MEWAALLGAISTTFLDNNNSNNNNDNNNNFFLNNDWKNFIDNNANY